MCEYRASVKRRRAGAARGLSHPAFALALTMALWAAGCSRPPAESPTRGHLAVAVSESHAPLLQREADLFNSLYPAARVDVRALSTPDAIAALAGGTARLSAVDRAPNDEERVALQGSGRPPSEVRLGEDALGVFVHASNPVRGISLAQLHAVLAGRTVDWAALPGAGGPARIRLVLPGRNSGVCDLLSTAFFPGTVLAPVEVAASESAVLQTVAATPGAIGIASVAAWKDPGGAGVQPAAQAAPGEPGWANGLGPGAARGVRALDLLEVDAGGTCVAHPLHQANVHRGVYPLHHPVTMWFDGGSPLAAGFAAFVASGPGQKLVLNAGLVPATMPVRLVTLK